MKKTSTAPRTTETKPARKLFGVSTNELRAVHGGGGVIVHSDGTTTPVTGG